MRKVAILCVFLFLSGCTAKAKNFLREDPEVVAIATARTALEGAREWYYDACFLQKEGLGASTETCVVYSNKIDPLVASALNESRIALAAIRSDSSLKPAISKARLSVEKATNFLNELVKTLSPTEKSAKIYQGLSVVLFVVDNELQRYED